MELFLLALTTWRIASLFKREPGPFAIFDKLRDWVGIGYDEHSNRIYRSELAKMIDCVWCSSVWIGLALSLVWFQSYEAVFYGLSASALAILFDGMVADD